MKTLIVGCSGEVGSAHLKILEATYEVRGIDLKIDPEFAGLSVRKYPIRSRPCPGLYEIMHVAIRYSDDFRKIVKDYESKFKPRLVDILTTVPPGTTESFGPNYVHSTTRGLHPNLESGLRAIPKHIGGQCSEQVANYFREAGLTCFTHARAVTTELAHIINNSHYGINLMFADEMAVLCRDYGVDYYDIMKYTESNNQGYVKLGHPTKVRPILTPPGGRIGGHCLIASANLIPKEKRTKMLDLLAIMPTRYADPN